MRYRIADLFAPPLEWLGHFDFVFEAYTLQTLPPEPRNSAIAVIARCPAPERTLLLLTRGRDEHDETGKMPWPLTPDEIGQFDACRLNLASFEDYIEQEQQPVRRFRVVYRRPNLST